MGDGGHRPVLDRRLRFSLAAAVIGTVTSLASTGCTSTSRAPEPTTTVSTPDSATTGSTPPVTDSPVTNPVSPAPTVTVAGGAFTAGRLSFRFDRSWFPSTWDVVSTASDSIVYLTPQPTHDPCVTKRIKRGTETICTSPVTSLTPGGLLITWYYYGLPGTALRYSPGRTVTIAGQPARLATGTADPACARIGGTRSVDATVQPATPDGSPDLLQMDACLTRPTQTAPVLAMLRTLTFTAPAVATSPTRFPPVAEDDPCQPLRDDPHFRQPPGNGALPWSSTVTAARWCEATPGPHGEQLTRYQSTGNVSALTRALHAPLSATAPTNLVCPAGPAQFPVAVEVLDQHGNLFRPTLPIDACGAISGTRNALSATASVPLAGS